MSTEEQLASANIEEVVPPETIPEQEEAQQVEEQPKEEQQEEESEKEETKEQEEELPLPEETKKEEKPIPKWVNKKLERNNRALEQKEQEAAFYKAELERMKSGGQQPHQFVDSDAPKREAFPDEASFVRAVIRHENAVEVKRQQEEQQRQSMLQADLSYQNRLQEAVEAGFDKYDDFEDKVKPILYSNKIPHNRAMGEAIVDSPHSSDILYFLGKYPDEAVKIANMNPVQAVKRIAEIEARFNERKKAVPSKTPPPISPITGGKAKTEASNLDDLNRIAQSGSQREFEDAVKQLNAKKKNPFS